MMRARGGETSRISRLVAYSVSVITGTSQGTALYLHFATIEPPIGGSPLTGNDRSRRAGRPVRKVPALPATRFDQEGKGSAAPPSPSNGNQPGRGSLASLTAPAPPRQIPAAPSPPLFATRQGRWPRAIAHWRCEEGRRDMYHDNPES